MSALVSSCKLVSLLKEATLFLTASLEKSLIMRTVDRGAAFLERSLQLSCLRSSAALLLRLYPERVYAIVDRVNRRLPQAELSPAFLFPLAYLVFLSLGKISLLSFLLVIVSLISFLLAFSLATRVKVRSVAFEERSLRLGLVLFILSLLALCADLYRAYKVPLLEPQARVKLSVAYTYIATFLVLGGVILASLLGKHLLAGKLSLRDARVYTLAIAVATTFLITLLGYRTQTVVSILAFTFVMNRYRIIGMAEMLIALGAGLLSVAALGYYRALVIGSEVGILEVIAKRADLTLTLYDFTVNSLYKAGVTTLLFGYYQGDIALATFSSFLDFVPGLSLGPRTIVARNFGVSGVSLTSTLLGTVSLDLGLAGIVTFALAIGAIIGAAYALSKRTGSALATALFSICFAYLLAGIETGLVDFNVFVLYAFTAFVAVTSIARM
jgi:oligosaccharide repeat unit polymerase